MDIGSSAESTFLILIPNETKNVSGDETATVNAKIRGSRDEDAVVGDHH